jgi:hypothetical protein
MRSRGCKGARGGRDHTLNFEAQGVRRTGKRQFVFLLDLLIFPVAK